MLRPILILTLTSLPITWTLECCDSTQNVEPHFKPDNTKAPIDGLKVAKTCYQSSSKTHARKSADRNSNFAGKNCDFCTIEYFFKDKALTSEAEEYYVQSCGRYSMVLSSPKEMRHPGNDTIY